MRHLGSIALLIVLVSTGCSTTGGRTSRSGNSDLLTATELEPMISLTAYQAIRRLRPNWLNARGNAPPPVVFVDGVRMGGLEVLSSLSATDFVEMRHRSAPDATTLYGTGVGGGTIELRSRSP